MESIYLGVDAPKQISINGILYAEVDGLSGEISQDVGPVASPERHDSLFPDTSLKAVHDTLIGSFPQLRVVFLSLKK